MMELPSRKPQRLRTWDYASPGAYFITFCTAGKRRLLGTISDAHRTTLSRIGDLCEDAIAEAQRHYGDIRLMHHVIMPNHIHMLLEASAGRAGANRVSSFVGMAKRLASMHAHRVGFEGALWQRSFHDHIVRNEADLERIVAYIKDNPRRWHDDSLYVG